MSRADAAPVEFLEELLNPLPARTEGTHAAVAYDGGIEVIIGAPVVSAANPFPLSLSVSIQATSDCKGVVPALESAVPLRLTSMSTVATTVVSGALPREMPGDVEQPATRRSRQGGSSESVDAGDDVATLVDPVVCDFPARGATQHSAIASTAPTVATTTDQTIPVNGWTTGVERLLQNMGTDLLNPGGIQINLHLPELGALTIGVLLKNGVLAARLDVQSPATLGALREKLSELEAALARQGYPVDLQINRLDEQASSQSGFDGQSSGESQQESPMESGIEPARLGSDVNSPPPVPIPRRDSNRGRLDIHI